MSIFCFIEFHFSDHIYSEHLFILHFSLKLENVGWNSNLDNIQKNDSDLKRYNNGQKIICNASKVTNQ